MKSESYVVKSNQLIESKGRMSALEQKLFAAMVSKIKKEDRDFTEYEIKASDIAGLTNSNYSSFYEDVHAAAQSLISRTVRIQDGKNTTTVGFLSSLNTAKGTGTITMRFDPALKPYLLDLNDRYTQYQLKNICNISGAHSIRIYELLKQYERIGCREISIVDLKSCLGIENSYSAFKDFEKRVLKPATEEINAETDISITYEKIRSGKSITSLKFTVTTKSEALDLYTPPELKIMRERLGEFVVIFTDTQMLELYSVACDSYPDDPYTYLRKQYEYMIEKGRARSKFSYLKKAATEDYAAAAKWLQFESYQQGCGA